MEELYRIFLASGGVISTDSRSVAAGAMFFALRGDNFDGNAYAAKALQAGAMVAVVDDMAMQHGCAGYVVVDDVLTTLQQLAHYHRMKLGLQIVALTGSNGKTTTKEFLKLALSTKYKVGATVGNLNNHIGVPLTLLNFGVDTQIGIVEMGASHCGEIKCLCEIAAPNVGLITNIGRAHLEGFGGQDGVKRGKGELYDYLQKSGSVAIYNSDDRTICSMVEQRDGIQSVGYKVDSTIHTKNLFGEYNAQNAAAAIAVAEFFGIPKGAAMEAIATFVPDNNRSQIVRTPRGNTLVVDCYNANPSSMQASISEFMGSDYPHKVIIVGDMKELGEYAADEHRKIVAMTEGVDRRYFVGDNFVAISAPGAVRTIEGLVEQMNFENATIFLKGSRMVGLEKLITSL